MAHALAADGDVLALGVEADEVEADGHGVAELCQRAWVFDESDKVDVDLRSSCLLRVKGLCGRFSSRRKASLNRRQR
jgi:hypothetical protein